MKNYCINFEELVEHSFFVEADTLERALEEFERQNDQGQIDYSNGQPTSSAITSVTCQEAEEVLEKSESYWDLERYKDSLISYISSNLKAASDANFVYQDLCAAGLTDEDIRKLGFEGCIPRPEPSLPDVVVTYKVDCRYTTEIYGSCVDTSDKDEVLKAARECFGDANIGELEYVSAEPVSIQTLDGDFLWEKGSSSDSARKLFETPAVHTYGTWVRTSDKLPDEGEEVIICFDDSTVASSCICDGDWELWANAPDEVIAWMPMPKEYRQYNPGSWIPVDIEPSAYGNYLVCTDEGFMATMEYTKSGWNLWDDTTIVAAWMHLPLPCVIF